MGSFSVFAWVACDAVMAVQVAERVISSDLEFLISKAVNVEKADYAGVWCVCLYSGEGSGCFFFCGAAGGLYTEGFRCSAKVGSLHQQQLGPVFCFAVMLTWQPAVCVLCSGDWRADPQLVLPVR